MGFIHIIEKRIELSVDEEEKSLLRDELRYRWPFRGLDLSQLNAITEEYFPKPKGGEGIEMDEWDVADSIISNVYPGWRHVQNHGILRGNIAKAIKDATETKEASNEEDRN
ncbi:hypothetical protein LCGC14_1545030 [marine sediment metagenome]|uniref:Uncharacterized protein n=1 Tax=marine sediment metagenome TaxID=412755 RepID=A0A0F9LSQ4_9ZZZZ